jgi:hypothetical protein
MKKQVFLDKVEQAWTGFQESYAGMTEEQMVMPGVTGEWSVKDILAHVSTWEAESLLHLPVILQGERPPRYSQLYGGIDAFNALMTAQWREHSLAEVLTRLQDTHARLMTYLQSVPDVQFATETRFRRRLGWDTYKHYPIHTEAIHAWRQTPLKA